MHDKDIARKIKEYINRNGIRQAYIVSKTGINKNKLSQSLMGNRKLTVGEYSAICKIIGVNMEYFIENSAEGNSTL